MTPSRTRSDDHSGDARTVQSHERLRELFGPPQELVLRKQIDHLDHHAKRFIELSPMVIVASADEAGRCDASPRGDPPGFVAVIDDRTLLIPDRKGNRRVDTMHNVIENPHVGLLFMIPGRGETLRVNGSAAVTEDSELLARCAVAGKAPSAGLLVGVEEVYLHCARAFLRSKLWDPESWPDAGALPSAGQIMRDHARIETSADHVEELVDRANADLY